MQKLNDVESEARAFAHSYAALFSSSPSPGDIPQINQQISECYRPGASFFTNGDIAHFATQAEIATLVEREMTEAGMGKALVLEKVETRVYSETAVVCWLSWRQEGREKGFVNIYGYRKGDEASAGGWEYIVRDLEVRQ